MSTIAEVTAEVLSFPSKSRAILADILLDSLNDIKRHQTLVCSCFYGTKTIDYNVKKRTTR